MVNGEWWLVIGNSLNPLPLFIAAHPAPLKVQGTLPCVPAQRAEAMLRLFPLRPLPQGEGMVFGVAQIIGE